MRMKIEVCTESGRRIILPIPNGLVRLLGPAIVKHTDAGTLSAEQCRKLFRGLKSYRKVLGGEPLVSFERADGRENARIWL